MGQRLIVTIENNKKTLAALYFHWSAYTGDALYATRDIIHCIYNHKDESEKEMLLRLIRFCEERGGCIDGGCNSEEGKYIQSLYPNEVFKETGNRSSGLIALSSKCIADMQSMSEGEVYINLDTDLVNFGVFGEYESIEDYNEEMKSCDDDFQELTLEEIPYIDYQLGLFNVNDIDDLIEAFEKTDDNQGLIRFKDELVELD